MYFNVTLSAIYNWKGSGTAKEQKNPNLLDSFCHLIIAQEVTTENTWMLLIDQGDDSGIQTTNCIEYIIPRICEQFTLGYPNYGLLKFGHSTRTTRNSNTPKLSYQM